MIQLNICDQNFPSPIPPRGVEIPVPLLPRLKPNPPIFTFKRQYFKHEIKSKSLDIFTCNWPSFRPIPLFKLGSKRTRMGTHLASSLKREASAKGPRLPKWCLEKSPFATFGPSASTPKTPQIAPTFPLDHLLTLNPICLLLALKCPELHCQLPTVAWGSGQGGW